MVKNNFVESQIKRALLRNNYRKEIEKMNHNLKKDFYGNLIPRMTKMLISLNVSGFLLRTQAFANYLR